MLTIQEMYHIIEKHGYTMNQISTYTGIPADKIQQLLESDIHNTDKKYMETLEKFILKIEYSFSDKIPVCQEKHSKNTYTEETNPLKDTVSDPMQYGDDLRKVDLSEKKQGDYTLEDYYALPDDQRVELIDGVFYDMSAPKIVHQDIASIVHMNIYQHIRKNKGDCKVFEAPVDVQINKDDKTMVQPDVLVVCDRDKIKDFGIFGTPDFILEILSPSTRKKDMMIKLTLYENAGVKEYWMIDPKKKILLIYNFMEEEWIPSVLPLSGTAPVAIFDGELMIDLDEIMASIEEFA